VPGYELLEELGRGGMGVVYKARHLGLGRVVALKMVLAGGFAGPEELQRFRTEAEVAARLQHPNLVTVYEVGSFQGWPYFTLEYLDGGSLAARLAGWPLPPREAAELVAVLATAVEYAHGHGIIHRDLKPANILLRRRAEAPPSKVAAGAAAGEADFRASEYEAKIADFGLAKRMDLGAAPTAAGAARSAAQTATGAVLGTPSYMAPEQAAAKTREIGPPADVYALGAVLYELLTGRPPFRAAALVDTLIQVIADEPVSVRRLQPQVPRDLETVCLRCLEKQPRRRYASAGELAADLRRFLAGEPVRARPVRLPGRLWKWVRRQPVVAALASAVVLAVLVGLGVSVWGWRTAEHARQNEAEQRVKALQLAADEAKARAQADAAEKEQARQRAAAVASLYASNVPLAQREMEGGGPARALELLNECPAGLRHWDWRYLKRQLDAGQRTFVGSSGRANGVAVNHDGSRLAVVYPESQSVEVWDVAGGRIAYALPDHGARVTGVAFMPKRNEIISAALNGNVSFWDARTGAPGRVLRHKAGIVALAVSADGKRLALGDSTRAVAVLDASNGRSLLALPARDGLLTSVALNSDGSLVTVGWQMAPTNLGPPTAAIWDVRTGRKLAPLTGQWMATLGLTFSPEGKYLAAASLDARVRIFDPQTGKIVPNGVLAGHHAAVATVAFSSDGRRLASAGWDHQVRVWNTRTWEQLLTFNGHDLVVSGVAFSPDGRHLASAAWDGVVKLWDLENGPGPIALVPRGLFQGCSAAAFNQDGSQVLAACHDGTMQIWSVTTGQVKTTIRGLTGDVRAVVYSADGQFVAAANDKGMVKLWDADGRERFTFRTPASGPARPNIPAPAALVFTPNGRRLVWADAGGAAAAWETAGGREQFRRAGPGGGGWAVALNADGNRLAWASLGGTIRIRNPAAAQDLLILPQPATLVNGLAFDPTSRYLASADQQVRLWDLTSGRQVAAFGNVGLVLSTLLAFSPDGRRLASLSGIHEDVRIWEMPGGRELLRLPQRMGVTASLTVSPNGQRLALAGNQGLRVWDAPPTREAIRRRDTGLILGAAVSRDGKLVASTSANVVNVWDRATGRPVLVLPWSIPGPGQDLPRDNTPASLAFSADGSRLAVGGGGPHAPGRIQLWDVHSGRRLHTFGGHKVVVMGVAFSADGMRLASASHDRTAKLWDMTNGKELVTLTRHKDRVNSVAFRPDGRWLATGSRDRTVKLWEVTTGRKLQTLAGHNGSVTSVAFHPGGRFLAVATGLPDPAAHAELAVWDVTTGRRVRTLAAESNILYAVAFHPGGRLLAAAGTDRVIHVWENATGQEILRLPGHDDSIMRLAFSGDGRFLVSCGYDGTVRVWDVDGLGR
jgi:WD40 repeat protein